MYLVTFIARINRLVGRSLNCLVDRRAPLSRFLECQSTWQLSDWVSNLISQSQAHRFTSSETAFPAAKHALLLVPEKDAFSSSSIDLRKKTVKGAQQSASYRLGPSVDLTCSPPSTRFSAFLILETPSVLAPADNR